MAAWLLLLMLPRRSNTSYRSRPPCMAVARFWKKLLQVPLFSVSRNTLYAPLALSTVRPHSSMPSSVAKKASLATCSAAVATPATVANLVICVTLSPNLPARSSSTLPALLPAVEVLPSSLFTSLSCVLLSAMRVLSVSRLLDISCPIGDAFSSLVNCWYRECNSVNACVISPILPLSVPLLVSISPIALTASSTPSSRCTSVPPPDFTVSKYLLRAWLAFFILASYSWESMRSFTIESAISLYFCLLSILSSSVSMRLARLSAACARARSPAPLKKWRAEIEPRLPVFGCLFHLSTLRRSFGVNSIFLAPGVPSLIQRRMKFLSSGA